MTKTFAPTALLVMEHNVTGLKYFCKTTLVNRVHRYKGSGTTWLNHLRTHGFNVKVGLLGFYVEEARCLDAAKKFSVENNIVESNAWANAIPETGRNGGSMCGERNPFFGKTHNPETIERVRIKKIGKSVNKGAYQSPEKRAKISAALKGRKVSDETKEKIRQARLAKLATCS